jgi:threonine synthase
LEVRYNRDSLLNGARKLFSSSKSFSNTNNGVWKYFDLLPIERRESIVSLGEEGNTPLVKLNSFDDNLNLYVKDETRNPTGSFKDRPNTVGISKAIELGAKKVAIASTGNASGSLAAYAAKAKIECIVAVPEDTTMSKLIQVIVFGAKLVKVRGTYSDAFNLIKESCKKFEWHNLTSVSSANPYQIEGNKTIAYELYEQLGRHAVPDWVVIPLGAGPLLVGIWKGFQELFDFSLIDKLPKLIGVQASGCCPIVRAFKNDETEVSPWEKPPQTIAQSIADPLTGYSQDGTMTLSKLRESKGIAESIDDSEMIQSVEMLARNEGIFTEPAGASSLAVVRKLKRHGIVQRDDLVVSIVTGTGLKSSETFERMIHDVPVIDPDPDSLFGGISMTS